MRDILLSLIIFGSVPWILSRPYIGVYIWYWVGLMSPHKFCYGFAYSMPIAQIVGLATLAGVLLNKDRKRIPWTTNLVLFAILYIYMAVTTVFAWVPEIAWTRWVDFGKIVLITLVMTTVIYGKERIKVLLLVAVVSVGIFGFKGGVFSLISGGEHRVWGPPGETFISGNNEIGLALCMVIPLMVALGKDEDRKWLRIALYASALLSALSVIFTYSRGALLGLATITFFIFLKSGKKYLYLLAAVPIVIYGVALLPEKLVGRAETIQSYEQDASAMQRLMSWKIAYRIAKDYPTGAGFDYEHPSTWERWRSYKDPEDAWLGESFHVAHSIYFQALGQHGFPGLLLFLSILISSLVLAQNLQRKARLRKETEWVAGYAEALQVGLLGYMVAGAFLNKAWFDLIWLHIGMLAILNRELQPVTRPDVPPHPTSMKEQRNSRAGVSV